MLVIDADGVYEFARCGDPLFALGVKTRAACRVCNNGWMSRAEQAVKPYLTPIIQGKPQSWHEEAVQSAVAAWTERDGGAASRCEVAGHLSCISIATKRLAKYCN